MEFIREIIIRKAVYERIRKENKDYDKKCKREDKDKDKKKKIKNENKIHIRRK